MYRLFGADRCGQDCGGVSAEGSVANNDFAISGSHAMTPRRYGPLPYAPIHRRPPLTWPDGAHIALWVNHQASSFSVSMSSCRATSTIACRRESMIILGRGWAWVAVPHSSAGPATRAARRTRDNWPALTLYQARR